MGKKNRKNSSTSDWMILVLWLLRHCLWLSPKNQKKKKSVCCKLSAIWVSVSKCWFSWQFSETYGINSYCRDVVDLDVLSAVNFPNSAACCWWRCRPWLCRSWTIPMCVDTKSSSSCGTRRYLTTLAVQPSVCLLVSVSLTLPLSLFDSVCLCVCLSHSLPLSLSLSLILPVSLSASLSFSFTLSVWFCVHVCLSVSPSLPVSLSLYQILSTSSIIFSYSLILTCFFLIPVSVPWFCAIQKVFIIIIIKWKFTQEVL